MQTGKIKESHKIDSGNRGIDSDNAHRGKNVLNAVVVPVPLSTKYKGERA